MTEDKKTNKSVSIHNRHVAAPGDKIIRQGDKGNQAFLIQSGKVRIYAEHNGKVKDLAVLGAGEIFGEMALIGDENRTATAEAVEKCNLIIITRPMIIEKLARTDPTIRALVTMLLNRIKRSNDTLMKKKDKIPDLLPVLNDYYGDIHSALGSRQKLSFEKMVKPKLDELIKALTDYHKLYGDP